MGDECTCEKCQGATVYLCGAATWPVGEQEKGTEGRAGSPREMYLMISERGISLRRPSADM